MEKETRKSGFELELGKRNMKKEEHKKGKSFSRAVWQIVGAFVAMIFLFLSVNIGARQVINQQVKNSIESIADSYVTEIVYRFDGANDYLTNLVITDADVKNANSNYDINHVRFIQSAQKVNDKLNGYQYTTGSRFRYLVYYASHDYFNQSDWGAVTVQERNNLKSCFKEEIESGQDEKRRIAEGRWKVVRVNDKWYVMNYSYYQDVYACCFVELEDLEKAIDRIEIGENSYVAFVSQDGSLYTHMEDAERDQVIRRAETGNANSGFFGYRNSVIRRSIPKADFDFFLVVENVRSMTASMLMQWLLLLFMFIGVGFLLCMSRYVKRELLNPMQYFFENLGKISEDAGGGIFFENSKIQELQQANELYKKIMDQAHQLKIEVYEKTEQQQRMQIEYMQLQIQPHFYINCMNMIHNMSCMGDEEGVQMMAAYVSDYFRYIFGISTELVDLEAELRHIENYLEICKMRYRMKVDYQITADGNLTGIRIPPLLLHTCVENSVKYGCKQGDVSVVRISVRKYMEEGCGKYVVIEVLDDGPGFEPEILKQLANRKEIVTDRGTRVGITNVMKRMEHIYGKDCSIEFSNRESGGARIWFKIPVRMETKE